MHSSRMRTARLLPVSPSMHCSRGVYLPGGVPAQGVYLPRGVPAQGGVPAQVLPLLMNRMTDRCKNITLPQTSFAGGNNQLYIISISF